MSDKYPKRKTCYSGDCKVTRTGFHHENYPVCKTCKQELSEDLYKRIKEKDEDPKHKKVEEDDLWQLF